MLIVKRAHLLEEESLLFFFFLASSSKSNACQDLWCPAGTITLLALFVEFVFLNAAHRLDITRFSWCRSSVDIGPLLFLNIFNFLRHQIIYIYSRIPKPFQNPINYFFQKKNSIYDHLFVISIKDQLRENE